MSKFEEISSMLGGSWGHEITKPLSFDISQTITVRLDDIWLSEPELKKLVEAFSLVIVCPCSDRGYEVPPFKIYFTPDSLKKLLECLNDKAAIIALKDGKLEINGTM